MNLEHRRNRFRVMAVATIHPDVFVYRISISVTAAASGTSSKEVTNNAIAIADINTQLIHEM